MNRYQKEKKEMQTGLLKIVHFIVSATEIVDKSNFQDTLYIINKQTEKLRRKFTNYR